MKCPHCQKEIDNGSIFCEYCGTRVNPDEKLGCLLSRASFLVPIVGLVLYLQYKDTAQEKAKRAGLLAAISFGINIVISIVYTIVVVAINTL